MDEFDDGSSKRLVGAIDEGTSSARFILFEAGTSNIVCQHQVPISKQCPQEGWVEQDPQEILNAVTTCINVTIEQLKASGGSVADIACVGVTNQRESTVVWERDSGRPLHPVLVWLDMRGAATVDHLLDKVPNRTRNVNYLKPLCGLPLSPYFSAVKVKYLVENSAGVSRAISRDNCMFGTIDSYLIYNLTGGARGGGVHVTDVTNAHRTSLLNLSTLIYDPVLLKFFDIPAQLRLPDVRSSSEMLGYIKGGPLDGVPITGCLGDQMAALVGQQCLRRGQAKATYGTGCFLLYNTGSVRVDSSSGLLTTVAYQMGAGVAPTYALEGSAAVAGAAFDWLRDGLGVPPSFAADTAPTADNSNDVVFVPAFSGLYAPYWKQDARGVICGITADTNCSHIVRAAMDALCFQTRDLLTAMESDTSIATATLNVDGGVTSNSALMQLLADITGAEVRRPDMAECTALGAAMCAGMALDMWTSDKGDKSLSLATHQWKPSTTADDRDVRYNKWLMAIERATGWLT